MPKPKNLTIGGLVADLSLVAADLWIGSLGGLRVLLRAGIELSGWAVVTVLSPDEYRLCREADPTFFQDLDRLQNRWLQLEQEDGEPVGRATVSLFMNFVRDHSAMGRQVAVCCGAGMSRSVALVIGYLAANGMGWEDAERQVRILRAAASPHPVLLQSIRQTLEEGGIDED